MIYVSKKQLVDRASSSKRFRKPGAALTGLRRPIETGFFFANARALAEISNELASTENDDDAIAILFRDSDGNASADRGRWAQQAQSMEDGFLSAQFFRGVPMIPRPKSEAWLICAVKTDPYRNCNDLEDRSGNDNSPNNLKAELAALPEFVLSPVSSSRLVELVRNGVIDPAKIEMPSFIAFRDRLHDNL